MVDTALPIQNAVRAFAIDGDALWIGADDALYRFQAGVLEEYSLTNVRSLVQSGTDTIVEADQMLVQMRPSEDGFESRNLLDETSLDIARCQLRATMARRDLVRAELNKMRLQFGQTPLMPIPDEFEVLVPLPDPPAGPAVDPRLPLRIPLMND